MNVHVKKIAVRTVLIVAAILVVGYVVMDRRMKKEYARFELTPTRAVNGEILAVWNRIVNYYLVRTPSGWIAFDTGGDKTHSRREFAAMGFDPSLVKAVFLTHSDSDHAGGVSLFPNARVFLSEKERDLATGRIRRAFIFKNSLNAEATWLKDGERVLVDGREVRLVETGGHTPGSAAFVVDGKYLFTGDAFAVKDGRIDPFNEFFTMDAAKAQESALRIASIRGMELLLTAHYGVHENPDRLFAEFLSRPVTKAQ
jgi:glyoxylase-like metal-dependent hydrolase (beta-lactamase superfamily II)